MARVVSLYLPNWPVERLRRRLGADAPPPDRALVLTGRVGRKRVVTACNAAAAGFQLKENSVKSQGTSFAGTAAKIGDSSVVLRSAWRASTTSRSAASSIAPLNSLS